MPRIIQSIDAFRRLLNISDAHSNRVSFRQGNCGVSTNNVPELIVGFGLAGRLLSCNSSATAVGLSTSKELFTMKTSSRWRKASAHREIGFACVDDCGKLSLLHASDALQLREDSASGKHAGRRVRRNGQHRIRPVARATKRATFAHSPGVRISRRGPPAARACRSPRCARRQARRFGLRTESSTAGARRRAWSCPP